MAEFAKAPNSCELNKQINRGWAAQVKPKGTGPENWRFVRGANTINPVVTTNGVDATDLDSDGWESEMDTSRSLDIELTHTYVRVGDTDQLSPDQQLLKITGEAIGAEAQLDVRVWRTDTDEGWETTVNNRYTPAGGEANGLRQATANMKSVCAPTRIHSVLKGAEREASVPFTDEELKALLRLDPADTSTGPNVSPAAGTVDDTADPADSTP